MPHHAATERLNPDYVAAVQKQVNTSPYFSLLSMEISTLDQGHCRMEILVQEKHLQPFGYVHGGVFSSLVDATAFWAVYPQLPDHLGLTTVEIKVNLLAPAASGHLIGTGRTLRLGKTICLAEASVTNENGLLMAHGTVTMMVLDSLKLKGQSNLPPKVL